MVVLNLEETSHGLGTFEHPGNDRQCLHWRVDLALKNGHVDHVLNNSHVNSSSKDELLDEDDSDIERTSISC